MFSIIYIGPYLFHSVLAGDASLYCDFDPATQNHFKIEGKHRSYVNEHSNNAPTIINGEDKFTIGELNIGKF